MNKALLIHELLEEWNTTNLNYLAKNCEKVPVVLELIKNDDSKLAWRSAYLLDKIHDEKPEIVAKYLFKIIQVTENTNNDSIRRQLLRILTNYDLSQKVSGNFINFCFNFLHNEKTAIAVKVHAMQILYSLSKNYTELKEELRITLDYLPPQSSAGVKSKARQILAKL